MKVLITLILVITLFNGAFGLSIINDVINALNKSQQQIEKTLGKVFETKKMEIDIKINTDDLNDKLKKLDIEIDLKSMSSSDAETLKKLLEIYLTAKKDDKKDILKQLKEALEELLKKVDDGALKTALKKLIEKIKADLQMNDPFMSILKKLTSMEYKVSIGEELKKAIEKFKGAEYAKNTIDALSKLLDALQKDLDAIQSGEKKMDLSNKSYEQMKNCEEAFKKVKKAWADLKEALSKSLDAIKASKNIVEALSQLMKDEVTKAAMNLFDGFYKMMSNGIKIKDMLSETKKALYGVFKAFVSDITEYPDKYKYFTTLVISLA